MGLDTYLVRVDITRLRGDTILRAVGVHILAEKTFTIQAISLLCITGHHGPAVAGSFNPGVL